MVIIHPNDPSTRFLTCITEELVGQKKTEITCIQWDLFPIEVNLDAIQKVDQCRTVLYMGHGGPEELNRGIDTSITVADAKRVFKNRKVILLSCNSADFLANMDNCYDVAIGFGNIPTSMQELNPADDLKYKHDNYRCISLYREGLVRIILSSLLEGCVVNSNFLELYHAIKLRINKAICNCSLSTDKSERLTGELLFELKKELTLIGNCQSLLVE